LATGFERARMRANVYQTLASLRITLVPNRRISTTHAPADHLRRPPNTKHHVLEDEQCHTLAHVSAKLLPHMPNPFGGIARLVTPVGDSITRSRVRYTYRVVDTAYRSIIEIKVVSATESVILSLETRSPSVTAIQDLWQLV
jgi:hypothetical protein